MIWEIFLRLIDKSLKFRCKFNVFSMVFLCFFMYPMLFDDISMFFRFTIETHFFNIPSRNTIKQHRIFDGISIWFFDIALKNYRNTIKIFFWHTIEIPLNLFRWYVEKMHFDSFSMVCQKMHRNTIKQHQIFYTSKKHQNTIENASNYIEISIIYRTVITNFSLTSKKFVNTK